jgi:hypothetical protein
MRDFSQVSRWTLVVLTGSVLLFVAAYFQPMWGFYLFSPQYPHGLTLSIYLDHVGGDVMEVNILNHYIGMAKLDQAAQFEREMSGYGVGFVALTSLLVGLTKERYSLWLSLPAFVFPVVFLSGMYFWMYRFGHDLSPHAPVRVKAFTPTLLGAGQIGNFHTIGLPGLGFYLVLMAVGGVALVNSRQKLFKFIHKCLRISNIRFGRTEKRIH